MVQNKQVRTNGSRGNSGTEVCLDQEKECSLLLSENRKILKPQGLHGSGRDMRQGGLGARLPEFHFDLLRISR